MDILENAKVLTSGGEDLGRVDRVVINPRTKEVTDIVVHKGFLLPEDKVIPIGLVDLEGGGKELRLKPEANPDDFLPFRETNYVPLDENELARAGFAGIPYPTLFWYPPYGVSPAWGVGYFGPHSAAPAEGYVPVTGENIPEGTVALTDGAAVFSADGEHVGNLARVGVDPGTGHATHMVISQGILQQSEKVIPVGWIDHVDDEGIRVHVGSGFIRRLPDITEE